MNLRQALREMAASTELATILRYLVSGGTAFLVHFLALVALVHATGMWPPLASTLGFALAMVVNFLMQHRYTFRSTRPYGATLIPYVAVTAIGAVLNAALMYLLFDRVGLDYRVAQIVATAIVLAFNFLANRHLTFAAGTRREAAAVPASCGSTAGPAGQAAAGRATVAVFDLDGTVCRGDTFLAFLIFCLIRRWWRLPHCSLAVAAYMLHACRLLGRDRVKEACLIAVLGGARRAAVEAWAADFVVACIAQRVKPAARAAIEGHRQAGHRVMLATASIDLYVPRLARQLGFDVIACTGVAWRKERLSGRLGGPNLRSAAKLTAVQRHLAEAYAVPPYMIAYSDDASDLPLLLHAQEAYAVDPSPGNWKRLAAHPITRLAWG